MVEFVAVTITMLVAVLAVIWVTTVTTAPVEAIAHSEQGRADGELCEALWAYSLHTQRGEHAS